MSKTLSEIRVEIDSIDNQVHDLLMQRAALVNSVAAAKKKEGLQIVQPAREARMMRRLLSRHQGPLPHDTIIRIWRELVGSVALLQSGFHVFVSANNGQNSYWDMAKEYFGGTVPMFKEASDQAVVTQVMDEQKESFGVLPWPEMESVNPWWASLLSSSQGDDLSVICALPYSGDYKALVVSKVSFLSSDLDRSFIALELCQNISRGRIAEIIEKTGLDMLNFYHARSLKDEKNNICLIEVDGFVDSEHALIGKLKDNLGDGCIYCKAVGGYPLMPKF